MMSTIKPDSSEDIKGIPIWFNSKLNTYTSWLQADGYMIPLTQEELEVKFQHHFSNL